jgi:hypothetical protein
VASIVGRRYSTPIWRGVWPRQATWRRLLVPLALAGAFVCAGQVIYWSLLGAWPFHDTVDGWLAGYRLREGLPVYRVSSDAFLLFLQAPPWAVIWAGLSFFPLNVVGIGLLFGQVLALRYLAGSWIVAGLLCWWPMIPRELVTGNVDLLMAAAILAGARGVGWPVALFAAAKLSPGLVLVGATRRQWREALAVGCLLLLITLPWPTLWLDWIASLRGAPADGWSWWPMLPIRLPLALVLLALRRPWAFAAAAALATPAFHEHSLVLLLPAARLAVDELGSSSTGDFDSPDLGKDGVAADFSAVASS